MKTLELYVEELRLAILLVGTASLSELSTAKPVLTVHVAAWSVQRGLTVRVHSEDDGRDLGIMGRETVR